MESVKCFKSNEFHVFDIEVPTFKQKIAIYVVLPTIVVYNPYTNDKVVVGLRKVSFKLFDKRIRQAVHKSNLHKPGTMQITLTPKHIRTMYDSITPVPYKDGDVIDYEFPTLDGDGNLP